MDYINLLKRSWNIVWHNKFMLGFGFIAALSIGRLGNTGFRGGVSDFGLSSAITDQFEQYLPRIIGLSSVAVPVIILLWILGFIAKTGLIDTAFRVEAGEKASFKLAWSAGRSKLGRMLGLNLLLFGIVMLFGIVVIVAGVFSAIAIYTGDIRFEDYELLGFCLAGASLLLIPYILVATVVQAFAQRAIVLEGQGVMGSIRRGWQIIRENMGDVLLLIMIFIVMGIIFGIVTFVALLPVALPLRMIATVTEEFAALNTGLLFVGGLVMVSVGAAVKSILIAVRSTAVTLAYQTFTDEAA